MVSMNGELNNWSIISQLILYYALCFNDQQLHWSVQRICDSILLHIVTVIDQNEKLPTTHKDGDMGFRRLHKP